MFRKVLQFWKDSYKTNKIIFFLEAFGTLFNIVGSFIFSFYALESLEAAYLALCLYLVGALTLTVTSYFQKNAWMLLLMMTFSVFNVLGLLRSMF